MHIRCTLCAERSNSTLQLERNNLMAPLVPHYFLVVTQKNYRATVHANLLLVHVGRTDDDASINLLAL